LTPKWHALAASSARTAGLWERRRALPTQRLDVLIAMGAAGLVSVTMLTIAAQLFFGSSVSADGLEEVHTGLAVVVGEAASAAFAVALLASGLAAAAVGAYAGQVVMAGFLRRRIPSSSAGSSPAVLAIALLTLVPTRPGPWSGPRSCSASESPLPSSHGLVHLAARPHGQLGHLRVTTIAASVIAGLLTPQDERPPAIRAPHAQQGSHQGRLTGSVQSDEGVDMARRHLQFDIHHRLLRTKRSTELYGGQAVSWKSASLATPRVPSRTS
jgi:hypothetical protein